jgi:hypothetical protein
MKNLLMGAYQVFQIKAVGSKLAQFLAVIDFLYIYNAKLKNLLLKNQGARA